MMNKKINKIQEARQSREKKEGGVLYERHRKAIHNKLLVRGGGYFNKKKTFHFIFAMNTTPLHTKASWIGLMGWIF
jgi:hypothetical protein